MIRLIPIVILSFLLQASAEPKAEITTMPQELANNSQKPIIVLNINFNIGNNQISSLVPSTLSKRNKVETLSFHILKVQRRGEFLRLLAEDEDGVNEWQKVQIEGLKYKGNDEVAWHYQEFDVIQNGKVIAHERLLICHKGVLDGILNLQDGMSLP